MNGQEPQVLVLERVELVENALLAAIRVAAENVAVEQKSAAEAKDWAAAAKSLADALVVLDPMRLQGGDTPEARRAAMPERPARRDGDRDGVVGER